MEPSLATETVNFLTGAVMGAGAELERWSMALVTVLTFFQVVHGYTKRAVKGDVLGFSLAGEAFIQWAMAVLVLGLYFSLAFPMMEQVRAWGMELSGSSLETVDIGELFKQREVVSERIYTTIDSFKDLGVWDQIKQVPEILQLNLIGVGVFIEYALIALIAIWIYAKFCLGFLVGGVFVGGLASEQMFEYGKRSISYVLVSTMPLFLLAFMQGVSARLIEEAPVLTGQVPITVPALLDLGLVLGFVVLLTLVAATVPREWLSHAVGLSGAPDASRTVGTIGGAGAAGMSAIKSIKSSLSSISNMSSGSRGGGSSPLPAPSGSGGANAGVPRLSFSPVKK